MKNGFLFPFAYQAISHSSTQIDAQPELWPFDLKFLFRIYIGPFLVMILHAVSLIWYEVHALIV